MWRVDASEVHVRLGTTDAVAPPEPELQRVHDACSSRPCVVWGEDGSGADLLYYVSHRGEEQAAAAFQLFIGRGDSLSFFS